MIAAAEIEKPPEDDPKSIPDPAEVAEEPSTAVESELAPTDGSEKPVGNGEEKPLIAVKVTSSEVQVTPSQPKSPVSH